MEFLLSYPNLLETKCFCCWQMESVSNFSFLYRYKGEMLEEVPRIFEAVFQCTLEV